MDFLEAIGIVKNVAPYLKQNEYDGMIIKKIATTNCVGYSETSGQTHFAITGEQMNVFPYIRSDGYFKVPYVTGNKLKNYFALNVPLSLYKENLKYLGASEYSQNLIIKVSVIRSRRKDETEQIEFGVERFCIDGNKFVDFKKLWHPDDYFVLLKRQNIFSYDCLVIRKDDGIDLDLLEGKFFYNPTSAQTKIDISEDVTLEDGSVRIPHLRNRIVFGAPGTGKSHRLKIQAYKYFTIQQQAEKDEASLIQSEIQEAGNVISQYVAIGINHSTFLKDKQPQDISKIYSCSKDNGYYIRQGVRAAEYLQKLPEVNDDELSSQFILTQLEEIKNEKYMMQACSAAIGYKYRTLFLDKSSLEIMDFLNLSKTSSQAAWIYYGTQAGKYEPQKPDEVKEKFVERVTFHPNYSYAQFVGTYKPVQDSADENQIKYEYVPGPFMRVYTAAKKNPAQNFLLLIEEINRANVAAVFGDVFQLLDRKGGVSEYPIAVSEDIKRYLSKKGIFEDELSIPSNMYIWATMNSADQGVFPMDTAFKRRWEFEYIGIDDGETKLVYDDNSKILVPVPFDNKEGSKNKDSLNYNLVEWNELRKQINAKLIGLHINEDKLLGPFFIGLDALKNAKEETHAQNFIKLFKSKVIMYLFEDVVKINPSKLFVECGDHPIYSHICAKFDEIGEKIFGFELPKNDTH